MEFSEDEITQMVEEIENVLNWGQSSSNEKHLRDMAKVLLDTAVEIYLKRKP
jgi:hypothetical protein